MPVLMRSTISTQASVARQRALTAVPGTSGHPRQALLGALGNTVVVITSEHGDPFGAHGMYRHNRTVYDSLVRVPLVVLPGPVRMADHRMLRSRDA